MFVPVVIVGAGHAGLAMSHRLTERSIDHVVLERGEVANSWRTERWESLRLLTPNWHARLPGHRHHGDDPDGFMSVREVTNLIADYARTIAAPVQSATIVTRVTALGDGYEITTDRGVWRCAAVVIATGACSVAVVPPIAAGLPDGVASVTPQAYRRADDLADGGVLIVGASATGVQLAEEIHRSGRPVTLAVGEHVRMPRTLPRPRHLLVDRRRRHPRRALRRPRRRRPRPPPPVAPTHRHPAAALDRSQLAAGSRGQDRRSARPDPRRRRPVLRIAAQHLQARRPQDEPAARDPRRVGHARRHRRRRRTLPSASSPPASRRPRQPTSTSSVTTSAP